jgi:hypothetical protein
MQPRRAWGAAACALAAGLVACAPALDWREVRIEGRDATVLWPCKPSAHARMVRLDGPEVRLTLQACQAGGMTFGLAWADMSDPSKVGPALRALRESSAGNLGAVTSRALPLRVPGQTPQPEAGRAGYSGRRPDGEAVQAQVAVVSRGTVVYQATVLGDRVADEAAETFISSLKLGV